MSEAVGVGATEVAAAPAQSAGAMLRQAREATGLHIAALAVSLKVSVKKLEALEADRLDELPDAVFVRGLASAVCRALRIDPQPVLARLPQRAQPVLVPEPTHPQAFDTGAGGVGTAWLSFAPGPAVWAVVALLMGAGVMGFLPEIKQWGRDHGWLAQPAATAAGAVVVDNVPSMAASAPVAVPSAPVASSDVPAAVEAPAASLTASAPVTPAVVASAATGGVAPPVPVAVGASAAAAVGDNVLRLSARAQTWVEVLDRFGAVAHKGTLAAGETVLVGGRLPLNVTIGRADGVSVQVRGQAFDLAPVTKANVAHFEVK